MVIEDISSSTGWLNCSFPWPLTDRLKRKRNYMQKLCKLYRQLGHLSEFELHTIKHIIKHKMWVRRAEHVGRLMKRVTFQGTRVTSSHGGPTLSRLLKWCEQNRGRKRDFSIFGSGKSRGVSCISHLHVLHDPDNMKEGNSEHVSVFCFFLYLLVCLFACLFVCLFVRLLAC